MPTRSETRSSDLRERVNSVPFWFHSIDLGNDVVTPGHKTPATLRRELEQMHLPDLQGKTVLDIGAFDGFFSFEAERRGAARVVALDHYMWGVRMAEYGEHLRECKQKGVPAQRLETTQYFDPVERPGMRGFLLAHEILGSRVETVFGDYMTTDVGAFDVVMYRGVLYHMEDPWPAMKRVAGMTKELAIIETAGVKIPGYEDVALFEFYGTDELGGDMTNWWAPNVKALSDMCRAAGFRRVEIIQSAGKKGRPSLPGRLRSVAGRVLRKLGLRPSLKQAERMRISAHAWK